MLSPNLKWATHIWHTDICCMDSQHTFVNFVLRVLVFTIFRSNAIFTSSSCMHYPRHLAQYSYQWLWQYVLKFLAFVTSIFLAPLMWTVYEFCGFWHCTVRTVEIPACYSGDRLLYSLSCLTLCTALCTHEEYGSFTIHFKILTPLYMTVKTVETGCYTTCHSLLAFIRDFVYFK
jgi:hypothetical protein